MSQATHTITGKAREYQLLARTEIGKNCRSILLVRDFDPIIVDQIVEATVEYISGEREAGLRNNTGLYVVCATYLGKATDHSPSGREYVVRVIQEYLDTEAREEQNG
jgi:hypothetical protein